MTHFIESCQYGFVHRQCRCPDANKTVRTIRCDREREHAPSPPKFRLDLATHEPPPPIVGVGQIINIRLDDGMVLPYRLTELDKEARTGVLSPLENGDEE